MRRLKPSLVLTAVLLLTSFAPAHAATLTVTDPAGDGQKGRRLDITSIDVRNRDHAVVTDVAFVRAAAGDLAIYYGARGDSRSDHVLVVSKHRPSRGDVNSVRTVGGTQECDGLKVTWDHEADTARVRLPSTCFRDGDYGAVRIRLIAEIGSHADYAPKGGESSMGDPRWAWTPYVARG